MPGQLDIVVSREFCDRFPDLLEMARTAPAVAFHPTEEPVRLHDKKGRLAVLRNDLRIGGVLRRAVERLRPDHCVLMYFDHVQASLARGLRFSFPVAFSGTYFRPSFYYRELGVGPSGPRTRLEDLQKRALLTLALRNPHFRTLFCLDPYAVAPIARLRTSARVVHLPEPFETGPSAGESAAETRGRLNVEDGRKMLLLFGSLDPRKGVLQLLTALRQLPDTLLEHACLVMAGETTGIKADLQEALSALRGRGVLQVIHIDAFVPDAEMHNLFGAADLVLMPYQQHVGSSGVLVRAAAVGAPVLVQDYGMLGMLARDRGLGLCVDTTRPDAIARGLVQFLDPSLSYPFDAAAARAFSSENTEEAMASTLFRHVLVEA
jgi:glycosyltransferase involved in cell wall biosynthesis